VRHDRLILAALMLLLLSGSAFAAQDGGKGRAAPGKAAADESAKALLAERERMKQEYQTMRVERREALEAALVRNVGGAVPVGSADAPVASVAGLEAAGVEGAAVEAVPEEEAPPPAPDKSNLILYVVGGGIVLGLLVKVVGPWWINATIFRIGRRRKRVAVGAMTVQLRPRHQRLSGS